MAYKHDPEIYAQAMRFDEKHGQTYNETGGRDGHIVDVSYLGGAGYLPAPLLQSMGRKTRRPLLTPLLTG